MILRRSATQDGEDHQSLAEAPSLGGSSMRRCIRRCYESTPQANLTTQMQSTDKLAGLARADST